MKSLVAAGAGCVAVVAIAMLDGTGTPSIPVSSAPLAGRAAMATPASYDLSFVDGATDPARASATRASRRTGHPVLKRPATVMTTAALGDVVKKTCAGCHSDQ
uniref:hypothetical protein n=1 Tax=Gemmatimonas sp. TaxID=1962908 RepID=UPI0027BA6BBA